MKYLIKESQLEKMAPYVEKHLNQHFENEDYICGFDVYVDDEENEPILIINIIINKEKLQGKGFSQNALKANEWRNKVREFMDEIFPVNYYVGSYPKNCED